MLFCFYTLINFSQKEVNETKRNKNNKKMKRKRTPGFYNRTSVCPSFHRFSSNQQLIWFLTGATFSIVDWMHHCVICWILERTHETNKKEKKIIFRDGVIQRKSFQTTHIYISAKTLKNRTKRLSKSRTNNTLFGSAEYFFFLWIPNWTHCKCRYGNEEKKMYALKKKSKWFTWKTDIQHNRTVWK